jgi:hypothetical protein
MKNFHIMNKEEIDFNWGMVNYGLARTSSKINER